jgi:hypothetical protein
MYQRKKDARLFARNIIFYDIRSKQTSPCAPSSKVQLLLSTVDYATVAFKENLTIHANAYSVQL